MGACPPAVREPWGLTGQPMAPVLLRVKPRPLCGPTSPAQPALVPPSLRHTPTSPAPCGLLAVPLNRQALTHSPGAEPSLRTGRPRAHLLPICLVLPRAFATSWVTASHHFLSTVVYAWNEGAKVQEDRGFVVVVFSAFPRYAFMTSLSHRLWPGPVWLTLAGFLCAPLGRQRVFTPPLVCLQHRGQRQVQGGGSSVTTC